MQSLSAAKDRLSHIAQARQWVIGEGRALTSPWVESWIERSWKRCLAWGHQPQTSVSFDAVSTAHARRVQEQHQQLVQAASAELDRISRAIAGTRYFALLTDAHGTVIDRRGDIDTLDRAAKDIARVGLDLSERRIGTTAIGAALAERQPIWLHRGEHFFQNTHVYSCAGAPVFDPQGQCVGMLDLTGVDVAERPELKHLAAQSVRSIENALLRSCKPNLLLHLNWPGNLQASDNDGLIGLDSEGLIVGANVQARHMLGLQTQETLHASEVFAMAWQTLFDLPQHGRSMDAPLWSGLRLQAQAASSSLTQHVPTTTAPPLKAVESDMIRRAMQQARGNVAEAAQRLGISRATLYRKLSPTKRD
jgi:transcriptional regulator of acetoin/glycerol metabolism